MGVTERPQDDWGGGGKTWVWILPFTVTCCVSPLSIRCFVCKGVTIPPSAESCHEGESDVPSCTRGSWQRINSHLFLEVLLLPSWQTSWPNLGPTHSESHRPVRKGWRKSLDKRRWGWKRQSRCKTGLCVRTSGGLCQGWRSDLVLCGSKGGDQKGHL